MSEKKITKIELFAGILVIALLLLYFLPKFMLSDEKKQAAILKTNAAVFTSNVLEKFARGGKSSDINAIAQLAIEELNATSKNPIDKKRKAFVTGEECVGCIVVETDTELQSVIITGYDKGMKTVVRTVIKPPSYVKYERDEEN